MSECMKKCLFCDTNYPSSTIECPSCNTLPDKCDDFPAYASSFATEAGGFKATFFNDLAKLEDENFWFRSRNRLIIWGLGKYCPKFRSFLEIGCGTGYVLSGIHNAFPEAEIHGSEIFTAGLVFAAARIPKSQLMQMDARQIPYVNEFDAIGAFDVLEHIEEDTQVLMQMHQALKPSGVMLLTVPQHPWLWSAIDDYACHVRRYSSKELHNKVENAGFEILRSTSFVSLLLPAMWVSRLTKRNPAVKFDATTELKINPMLNRLFEIFLAFELFMIKAGINFPLGGSRFLLARKP